MAHTYALGLARASSAGNPVSFSYTVAKGDTVICLLIKTRGASDRTGGAPTWGALTFTQRHSTQKAAASPECGCEVWDLINPAPGTATLTIPNTGAATLFYTVAIGRAQAGGKSAFEGATGSNGTSTNPSPGAVTLSEVGCIGFAIVASGAQTWGPSAQGGAAIANTDDGADGGGEQYAINGAIGSSTLGWTFGTSDDWGAVVAFYKEIPPHAFQNYFGVKADSGISVGERIR